MRRERIEIPKTPRKGTPPEVLPLDPRDPEVVRAKQLIETQTSRRRRAA